TFGANPREQLVASAVDALDGQCQHTADRDPRDREHAAADVAADAAKGISRGDAHHALSAATGCSRAARIAGHAAATRAVTTTATNVRTRSTGASVGYSRNDQFIPANEILLGPPPVSSARSKPAR